MRWGTSAQKDFYHVGQPSAVWQYNNVTLFLLSYTATEGFVTYVVIVNFIQVVSKCFFMWLYINRIIWHSLIEQLS